MLGAISPSAAAGFRPICVQRCASECTSAQACIERTRQIFGSCFARPGNRPVGQLGPLITDGLKFDGVVPFRTLRSNVSTWLGAPASKIKMQFLALFCVVT